MADMQLGKEDVARLLRALGREMLHVERRIRHSKPDSLRPVLRRESVELLELTERLLAYQKDLSRVPFKLKVRRT